MADIERFSGIALRRIADDANQIDTDKNIKTIRNACEEAAKTGQYSYSFKDKTLFTPKVIEILKRQEFDIDIIDDQRDNDWTCRVSWI